MVPQVNLTDWNFFATLHGKGENDGVHGEVNVEWWKPLQLQTVVTKFEFVSVAAYKFSSFVTVFCPIEEVRCHSEFLREIGSPWKTFHYIEIVENEIVGYWISPSCLCHQKEI